jgi:hypothetical protein
MSTKPKDKPKDKPKGRIRSRRVGSTNLPKIDFKTKKGFKTHNND